MGYCRYISHMSIYDDVAINPPPNLVMKTIVGYFQISADSVKIISMTTLLILPRSFTGVTRLSHHAPRLR